MNLLGLTASTIALALFAPTAVIAQVSVEYTTPQKATSPRGVFTTTTIYSAGGKEYFRTPILVNCGDLTQAYFNQDEKELQIHPVDQEEVKEFCAETTSGDS